MASRIRVRTRNGEFGGELDGSDLSNEIWLSLPFSADLHMLGSQVYFEMLTETKVKGDGTVFEKGDIAYWPKANAMCLFYGPTPLSGEDGKPVSAFPLKKIGHLLDDYSQLEDAGDGQKIKIERDF